MNQDALVFAFVFLNYFCFLDCKCNNAGTVSLLNDCDQLTGQCLCKFYVLGVKCDRCLEGFYNLSSENSVGCQGVSSFFFNNSYKFLACNCDNGGSIGISCDQLTGQCKCKSRVQGLKCNEPIQEHYFPTLWHMKVFQKFSLIIITKILV